MKVIGISPLDKDSTVSFMEDGKILFACSEERLSRMKLQDGFPVRSMKMGFEYTGWKPEEITAVAYAFYDGDEEAALMRKALAEDASYHSRYCTADSLQTLKTIKKSGYKPILTKQIPGMDSKRDEFMPRKGFLKSRFYNFAINRPALDWSLHRIFFKRWVAKSSDDHRSRTRQLHEGLDKFGLSDKLQRFNHHDTHAANSFYASGYDEALMITLDGYGSGNCGGVYLGNAEGLKALHKFSYPNSLGLFYEMVTGALGFKPGRHEGKIVGLAAYGDPELLGPALRERFVIENGDIKIRASMNYFFARGLAEDFAKRDIAAAYQYVLEQVTQEVSQYWVQKTGISKVAVSGGVNANVKLNQRIAEIDAVDSVFAYPNMGDGGCATGAAMLAFEEYCRPAAVDSAFLGPEYTDAQIATALEQEQLAYERPESIETAVGELLSGNHIIARFNGRMEYGPRALGNRSILYPAQEPEVNLWLNHQLGRTEFMPFAPAVLESEFDSLFHHMNGCEKTAEYMTVTFNCTERMAKNCPAAVHIDCTARPQLVTPGSNESLHKIISAYNDITGIPAVINTSFNMHEEPIVCSPEDAVRAFLLGNIDYLAIGPYLVPHPKLESLLSARETLH